MEDCDFEEFGESEIVAFQVKMMQELQYPPLIYLSYAS